jgi:hypothetical protein
MARVSRFVASIVVAAPVAALLHGCCFGRSYGPQNHTWVKTMTKEQVAAVRVVGDREVIDAKTCTAWCGEEAVHCAIATIDPAIPTKAPPLPRLICDCDEHDGKGAVSHARPIDIDTIAKLAPGPDRKLDNATCERWGCCFGDKSDVLSCALEPRPAGPPPPRPDERVLVCETHTPGGCDMIPR